MVDSERLRDAISLQYQTCRGLGAEVSAAALDGAQRDTIAGDPVDFADPEAALRLCSYVWPDAPEQAGIWPAGRGREELLADAHPHRRRIKWHRRGIQPLIEEMDA